jgi:hypothetical protein
MYDFIKADLFQPACAGSQTEGKRVIIPEMLEGQQ